MRRDVCVIEKSRGLFSLKTSTKCEEEDIFCATGMQIFPSLDEAKNYN